ncbi:MAG: DUF2948 family protein [Paracoccaceae bacterium]
MVEDARFEEGAEKPLRLKAIDREDLAVMATLVQDAVFPITEMSWQPAKRRFGLFLNRFRWEDMAKAEKHRRPVERVQAMMVVNDVMNVESTGIERGETDTILSLLDISFAPGKDGTGRLEFTLAGDGAIALQVECLDVMLSDVTRPYKAPSGSAPSHEPETGTETETGTGT